MHPLEYDSPLAAAKGSSITPNNRSSDELCCSHYSAICKDWVAKRNRTTRNSTRNCSFKTGSRHQSEKRTILKQFLKAILTGKSQMPNLTNHYRNLDAHTPIRFTTSLSAAKDNSVRKQPQRQTLMQPHCVLQHHTWQTHMYLPIGTDYARNDPGRTRVTHELPSIAGCSHLNTRFRAPASSPTQMPCNIQIHAAITMRFAAARALWCSHYNAICIHALQNTNVFLGTTTAATAARTHARTHTHTHTHKLPFYRRPQPLYTEKHKVSCSGFLPKTNPMPQSCSHYNAFWSSTCPTRMSRHTWQQNDNNHAAIPLRSASPSFVITTSPPFVITTPLRHHFPQSPPLSSLPSVTTLRLCDVLLSDVKSHNSICLWLGRLIASQLPLIKVYSFCYDHFEVSPISV